MTGADPSCFQKRYLAFLSLLSLLACGDQPQMQAPPPPTVQVIETRDELILPSQEFVARTSAVQDITINSRVSGPLLRRAFEEGSDVEQGDLLFEIDPANYRTAVNQARARLEQANAAKKVALNNYTRGQKIFADGVISAKEMDELTGRKLETEAQVENAKAELEEAQLNLGYTKITAPISGRISQAFVFQGDLISPDVKMANLTKASLSRIVAKNTR
jgi:membrane fusion protein (multidrug efflux system)